MTQEEFENIANLYQEREAFINVLENMEKKTYGRFEISENDFYYISEHLKNLATKRIDEINGLVEAFVPSNTF